MPKSNTKAKSGKSHDLKVVKVPVAELKEFPGNPRVGNVSVIAESLEANGQYRPIVVRKATNEVLTGNHTLKAARKLGWHTIDIVYVDVDEIEAKKIVLADNRSSDIGTYDMDKLAAVLQGIPDVTGTGYTETDMKSLLSAVETGNEDIDLNELLKRKPQDEDDEVLFTETEFGEEPDELNISGKGEELEDDEKEPDELAEADEDLGGVVQLKESPVFDGWGYWGIPILKKNMLMTPDELPPDLLPWAGFATRNHEDPEQWWFYNYGESLAGVKDIKKVILSFYAFDETFEKWWWYPEKYTAKAINAGIKYAVCPNFTASALEPHALNLQAIFKSRWLGRYFQEAGMKVIPDISWPRGDLEFLEKQVLGGIPTPVPMIVSQRQTFDHSAGPDYVKSLADGYRMVCDKLKPDTYIIYSSTKVFEWMRTLKLPTKLVHIVTRTEMMRNSRAKPTPNPLV